ncbi:MAG: Mur ligase domain-containing protein [Flavobacteriales bacterium]|nr:Mur ligase domain-containing protein [Flavobacteriales bacterium]
MNVHFIAIGGSAMHNLALALAHQGDTVTGSDDEIFEPSRSRLADTGILPTEFGWFPEKIHEGLDAIILGMHAREDNPELLKAKELGLNIYSYPEYLYQRTRSKKRAVIGGSHGKTTITSMVLHALNYNKVDHDYMVGALLDGFERSVLLKDETPIAVFEGDEYLSSPIDRRPKFHLYNPHIALISGIAWDHMNVFPTFDNYVEQFRIYVSKIEDGGVLIYNAEDEEVVKVAKTAREGIRALPYHTPNYRIDDGKTFLKLENEEIPIQVFGKHNLQNMEGARLVCAELGVSTANFYEAMQHFRGASRRLEKMHEEDDYIVYRDFAHAPSKLKATTSAVKEMYPNRHLLACMELHTFSSLNKAFLHHYEGAMNAANTALVYFSPDVVAHKRLPEITIEDVSQAFGRNDLKVFTDAQEMQAFIESQDKANSVRLLMSSGNWGGATLF